MRLRFPHEHDVRAIVEACADPEIPRWTRIPSPYTIEDGRAWVALAEAQRKLGVDLSLVVTSAKSGRLLGGMGLRRSRAEARSAEVGYWIAAEARGQGVGRRGLVLLCDWALGALPVSHIELAVSPRNEASRRLARSAGFERSRQELREFRGRLEEFEIYLLDTSNIRPDP